jgi:hypothetical protein
MLHEHILQLPRVTDILIRTAVHLPCGELIGPEGVPIVDVAFVRDVS